MSDAQQTASFDALFRLMRAKIDNFDTRRSLKSAQLANESKGRGNELLKARKFEKALDFYNKALRNCPISAKEQLSLIVANRSLTFFQMGRYDDCLDDIQLALDFGYPENLREKLLKRRQTCRDKVASLNGQTSETLDASTRQVELHAPFLGPLEVYAASDRGGGRAVRASRRISCGEVLLVERAYTAILLPEYFDKFCYNCLKKVQNERPYPCCKCSQVVFCSSSCADICWEEFHGKECGYLDLLDVIDSSLYSPKMTLKVTLSENGLRDLFSDTSECKEERFMGGYDAFNSLAEHVQDTNNYTKIATFLLAFLAKAYPPVLQKSHGELLAARDKLIKHIRQCQVNSMHLTYREIEKDAMTGLELLEEQKIGCALFLKLAMTNHSCDPNARAAFFDGNVMQLHAIKDVEEQDELTISYGMFHKWHLFQERQKQLRESYFFDCRCAACEKQLQPVVNAYKCLKCKGAVIALEKDNASMTCLNCNRKNTIDFGHVTAETDQATKLISLGVQCLNEGGKKLLIGEKLLKDGHHKLSGVLYRNHTQISIALDMISLCYKKMSRYEDAISYAKKYLELTRSDFDDDVYLFNAYVKLIDCYQLVLEERMKSGDKGADKTKKLLNEALLCAKEYREHLRHLLPASCREALFYGAKASCVESLCENMK